MHCFASPCRDCCLVGDFGHSHSHCCCCCLLPLSMLNTHTPGPFDLHATLFTPSHDGRWSATVARTDHADRACVTYSPPRSLTLCRVRPHRGREAGRTVDAVATHLQALSSPPHSLSTCTLRLTLSLCLATHTPLSFLLSLILPAHALAAPTTMYTTAMHATPTPRRPTKAEPPPERPSARCPVKAAVLRRGLPY